jgi:hypothetical protein
VTAIPKTQLGPAVFRIKQGSTLFPIEHVAVDELFRVVNLLGATGVSFIYRKRSALPATAVIRVATIVKAETGQLRYDWIAADTAVAGDYYGEWEVSFPNSGVQKFPIRGYQLITVEPDLS